MKTFNRFKAFAVLFCLAFLTSGCHNERDVSRPAPVSVKWWISVDCRFLQKNWADYEILRMITTETGISPAVEFFSAGNPSVLTQRLLAGERPDMITCLAADTVSLRIQSMLPTQKVSAHPELLALLPQSVIDFHSINGELLYLPGGFRDAPSEDEPLPAAEGIYVNQEILRELQLPPINSMETLLSATEKYLKSVSRKNSRPFYIESIRTLEHTFGIGIPHIQTFLSDGTTPPEISRLQAFFASLRNLGLRKDIFSPDDSIPFLLIGSWDNATSWNLESGSRLFAPVDMQLPPGGFWQSISPFGKYATYLWADCSAKALELAAYLLSDQGSRLAMYGIEDRHWLWDTGSRRIIPLNATISQPEDFRLIQTTGLSLFPYLSRYGSQHPGWSNTGALLRDTLAEDIASVKDPTSEDGMGLYTMKSRWQQWMSDLLAS